MGDCASRPENVKLGPQNPLGFAISPSLVKGEQCEYVLKERVSLKSIFLGQDGFKVKEYGTGKDVMELKQSVWDLGQDRMELKDCKDGRTKAVVRRARVSMKETFYIYTVQKPYKEADFSNESLDGQKLYCWGYLCRGRVLGCVEDYDLGVYYFDPEKADGKDHPYKPLYAFRSYNPFFDTKSIVGFLADEKGGVKRVVDENGEVKEPEEAICITDRDAFQWTEANTYGLRVASGVDAGLMVLVVSMIDEIREDGEN